MSENVIVYQPSTLTEVQSLLKNNQHIKVMAGGTELLRNQLELSFKLPRYVLSLCNVKELYDITKTERYIDFGAMVSLGRMIDLGEKNIGSLLYSSLKTIASRNVRFLSTIGGNLEVTGTLKTLMPVMMTLDTRVEVKTAQETVWVPYLKYVGEEYRAVREAPHVITRVRMYTDAWNYSFFERLGKKGIIDDETAYFSFLVKCQKNLITDVRLCFSVQSVFRSKELENTILGEMLPFSVKDVNTILQNTKKYFTDEKFTHKLHKLIFFNLVKKCLLDLTSQ